MKRVATVGVLIAGTAMTALVGIFIYPRLSGSGSTAKVDSPAAQFDIARGPRLALLPVSFNGKTVLFCVDTGASKTVFDKSLSYHLGQSLGTTTAATPAGSIEVELYPAPRASVGPLDLSSLETVACHDLTNIRYASGQEVYGILGMDFLRNYAIELDFDAGKCQLWKEAPTHWDKQHSVPISFDQSNRPQIPLAMSGGRTEQFIIDTGANASTLRGQIFDELIQRGAIDSAVSHHAVAMAGTIGAKSGYVRELRLGQFAHSTIRLDRDQFSVLGARYLSRYKVHLDFNGGIAIFAAGTRCNDPDPIATSGLGILQVEGEKIICSVEPSGPGASAGLIAGDVIVRVDNRDANDCDMVALHEILTRQPGSRIPLRLRRATQNFDVALELQSRFSSRR
jgi:hypothetical protein